jgi:DNA-directed RNA polymerase subunit RPC12/RpoP
LVGYAPPIIYFHQDVSQKGNEGDKMKSYVVCPDCGTVFGVAEKIENMEIRCHKCRGKMIVNVNEKGLFVTRMPQMKTVENAKQIHITADIKL